MAIPNTRQELLDQLNDAFEKLQAELEASELAAGRGSSLADLLCVDDWTVKDVLAVRRWWTARVGRWVESGLAGKRSILPARGYRWNETPRLNAEIVTASQQNSWPQVTNGLSRAYGRLIKLINKLDNRELLETGVFDWAGRWPISRWISINSTRQYQTARAMIRKARRATYGKA